MGAEESLAVEHEKYQDPFRGAWRGAGSSGLSGLSSSFGSTDETNAIDEIDRTDPRTG
jgi:hypothetical protein